MSQLRRTVTDERLGREKHIYIEIYRYSYIHRQHRVLALLLGLAEQLANGDSQHLNTFLLQTN